MDEWIRCNKESKCPICGKGDWCMVARDGTAAICPRVSDGSHRNLGESGWLHKIGDGIRDSLRKSINRRPSQSHPSDSISWPGVQNSCERKGTEKDRLTLGRQLGVRASSLSDLGVGLDLRRNYTFPMHDGRGNVIGIRIRSRDGGAKWAWKGSRNGLFLPRTKPTCDWLYICEGPTDTAACIGEGLAAIGRASCNSGKEYIYEYVKHQRQIIIIADTDGVGMDGAWSLAHYLADNMMGNIKVICPSYGKDVREWIANGATGEMIQLVADQISPVDRRKPYVPTERKQNRVSEADFG